jgi:hypothetical protein
MIAPSAAIRAATLQPRIVSPHPKRRKCADEIINATMIRVLLPRANPPGVWPDCHKAERAWLQREAARTQSGQISPGRVVSWPSPAQP